MKKILASLILIILLFNLIKSKPDTTKEKLITSEYIKDNFNQLSQKSNLIDSFQKIFKLKLKIAYKKKIYYYFNNKLNMKFK